MDVLFEDQIVWARAEAKRIRDVFGDAVAVEVHLDNPVWGAGARAMTLWDPHEHGATAAICITAASAEGMAWRAELRPVIGDDHAAVPETKSIGAVDLEIRYGRCVHATGSHVLGKPSGDNGQPDFVEAISKLVAGKVKVTRQRALGGRVVQPYAGS